MTQPLPYDVGSSSPCFFLHFQYLRLDGLRSLVRSGIAVAGSSLVKPHLQPKYWSSFEWTLPRMATDPGNELLYTCWIKKETGSATTGYLQSQKQSSCFLAPEKKEAY